MINKLDKQYTDLLQDILDNGVPKSDRTTTGTLSVFGRQIRHRMSEGFPLLTTKKMPFKTVTTELLWFLQGNTNIKYLVDNGCNIWTGDAYKNYINNPAYKAESVADLMSSQAGQLVKCSTQEEFVEKIKTDDEFANMWGDLGPMYGAGWRRWGEDFEQIPNDDGSKVYHITTTGIDQIANLINELKTNPDSRRLMVNAWNVGELDSMVLPPCHYGFQVYTRELSKDERMDYWFKNYKPNRDVCDSVDASPEEEQHKYFDDSNVPKRAISLMWNQRSVDTFLGLPFNIASYGLLLEIIAKAVNMVPDELIGNLGDTHLYSNHIEQAKEQIGREMTWEEQVQWVMKNTDVEMENLYITEEVYKDTTPTRTRQPYPLPTLNINTEFWPYEGGSCGEGPLDAVKIFESFKDDNFCKCLLEEDIQLSNYQSHPSIKASLSN
jgi:thymidylate synthase